MIVTALKCDQCKIVLEVKDIPDGWATVGATIRIRGTTHNDDKGFKKRRDALAALVPITHIRPDCIEILITGKVSLKISQSKKENQNDKTN